MASLKDTISSSLAAPGKRMVRNAQGQLVEQAVPISQLAGQAGLTAPPISPGAAASLGASPDSAKMAGTPGQLASAIRQSTDSVNTLAEATADKRYRSSLTSDEQARGDTQKKLSTALGGTGERVKSLIDAEVAKLRTPAPPTPTTPTAPVPVGTDTPEYAKYTSDLANWESTTQNNTKITGYIESISKQLSKTKLGSEAYNRLATQRSDLLAQLVKLGPKPTVPVAGPAIAAPVLTVPVGIVPLSGKSQADLDAQWKILTSDPSEQNRLNAMSQLQQITGKSSEELNGAVSLAASTQLANAAGSASSTVGTIGVSSLFSDGKLPDGTTPEQLSSLLGVPVDQLNNMTIDQLDEAVNALGQTTQQTQQQSNNMALGAAERAALNEQAIDQSTSGASAIDQQLLSLGADLEKADQVSFLGKTGSIAELLSDENISKQVTDLVSTGGWKTLPDTDPLKQFIQRYESALSATVGLISKTGEALDKVTSGRKAALTFGNSVVPPELASKLLGFDVTSSGTTALDISKSPLLSFARGLSAAEADILFDTIRSSPGLAEDLNKLNPRELAALDIGNNGAKWQTYKTAKDNWDSWNKIKPNDIDGLLSFAFDPPMSKSDAAAAVGDNFRRKQAGLTGDNRLDILDSDGDGKLGPLGSLRTRIEKSLGPKSVKQAANNVVSTFTKRAAPPVTKTETTEDETNMVNYLSGKPTEDQMLAELQRQEKIAQEQWVDKQKATGKYTPTQAGALAIGDGTPTYTNPQYTMLTAIVKQGGPYAAAAKKALGRFAVPTAGNKKTEGAGSIKPINVREDDWTVI